MNLTKFEKAKENYIFLSGKKYFDLSLNSGVLFLGHNHSTFISTLKNIVEKKISLSDINKKNINLIQKLIKFFFKSSNKIITCSTGSESVIKSIRICKALTNKEKIFLVNGSWHGSVDQTLFHSKKNLKPIPLSSGLGNQFKKNIKILPYNDINSSKIILDKYSKDVCCLIIEPISASLPLEKSKKYLKFLRSYCNKKKIILIFDEIISGIRTDRGSVQNKFKIYPDITLAGKVIGGGMPISLILINKKISNKILKLKKKIFFGGTFSGNNYSIISCINTLLYLKKNSKLIKKTIKYSNYFQKKLNEFLIENNIKCRVYRFDSFLRIVFSDENIKNRISRDFLEGKKIKKITLFKKFLLKKRILYPNNGIIFFSTVISKKQIDTLIKITSIGLKKYFK